MAIKSTYISSGDAQIYCECYGDDHLPPLLLLHGNGEDLHYFDPQTSYFAQSYHIIAMDSRGHGKSTRGSAPLNFNTMAEDVICVINALNKCNINVIGFSDGAILAIHLALKAPELVHSMVLLGANYSPEGLRFPTRFVIRMVYSWLTFASFFSKNAKKKKEIWNLMVHHPQLTLEEIAQIKIPTLIVTGEHDMVTQKQNDEIHHAIAGSKCTIIPGADHFLSSKKPEVFNRMVEGFLTSLNS